MKKRASLRGTKSKLGKTLKVKGLLDNYLKSLEASKAKEKQDPSVPILKNSKPIKKSGKSGAQSNVVGKVQVTFEVMGRDKQVDARPSCK